MDDTGGYVNELVAPDERRLLAAGEERFGIAIDDKS